MANQHVGDYGGILKALVKDQDNVVVNLSTFDTLLFLLTKPGGTTLTKTASFTTDGTDGYIQYTVESGVLNEPGTWQFQGRVVKGTTERYSSDLHYFKVDRNL